MPEDCHFYNRKEPDIQRELKEIIFDTLENRIPTVKEQNLIKEVANECFDLAITNHKMNCERDKKQGIKDWLPIVISIISLLLVIYITFISPNLKQ